MSIRLIADVLDSIHGVTAAQKLLLVCLADHANDEGLSWPSVKTLARRVGVSERHIPRMISDLPEGIVEIISRPNKSNCYQLNIPSFVGGDTHVTPDPHVTRGVTPRSPGGDAQVTSRGDAQVTQNRNGTVNEPSEEPNPPTPLTDSAFEKFWAAFPGRRKVDKKKCATWWSRHVKTGDVEKVMAGLESWKASPDWKKNGGEYVPMPYTWLNNERWEVVIVEGDPHAGEPPTWDNTEPDKETNLKGWQMWNQDRMVGAKPGWRKYT